jgi:hypothetical protein
VAKAGRTNSRTNCQQNRIAISHCFVGLLGYQPLTDGVCDDVLDVVEGIASDTVINLMREEKGIRECYDSDKNMYT